MKKQKKSGEDICLGWYTFISLTYHWYSILV